MTSEGRSSHREALGNSAAAMACFIGGAVGAGLQSSEAWVWVLFAAGYLLGAVFTHRALVLWNVDLPVRPGKLRERSNHRNSFSSSLRDFQPGHHAFL